MDREEIEQRIKEKIAAGKAETGLIQAGVQWVVVDIVNNGKGDEVTFTWFDSFSSIDDILRAE